MKASTFLFALLILLAACSPEPAVVQEIPEIIEEEPVAVEVVVDTVPPLIDSLLFNNLALECFFPLGHETGGEFYFKTAAEDVYETITEVIQDHGENGSDIVILIDKTGSMMNDIENVRTNLGKIIDVLEHLEDVQLAVSVYGDKVVDGDDWWGTTPLTTDFKSMQSFIDNLQLSGGGDYPESVYDGLGNAIKETDWRADSKRMVLVIGDAPSLDGEHSDYTQQEIIELCEENNVKANIFPILISTMSVQSYVDFTKNSLKLVDKIYPNPVVDEVNIDFAKEGEYKITLLSMKGEVIIDQMVNGTTCKLSIPGDVAAGNYVLRVMEPTTYQINAENIVISR